MALILSTHGNTALRSEDISFIGKVKNPKTGKATSVLGIILKSGAEMPLKCRTIKEADELFDDITKIMIEDYKWNGFHKP